MWGGEVDGDGEGMRDGVGDVGVDGELWGVVVVLGRGGEEWDWDGGWGGCEGCGVGMGRGWGRVMGRVDGEGDGEMEGMVRVAWVR